MEQRSELDRVRFLGEVSQACSQGRRLELRALSATPQPHQYLLAGQVRDLVSLEERHQVLGEERDHGLLPPGLC